MESVCQGAGSGVFRRFTSSFQGGAEGTPQRGTRVVSCSEDLVILLVKNKLRGCTHNPARRPGSAPGRAAHRPAPPRLSWWPLVVAPRAPTDEAHRPEGRVPDGECDGRGSRGRSGRCIRHAPEATPRAPTSRLGWSDTPPGQYPITARTIQNSAAPARHPHPIRTRCQGTAYEPKSSLTVYAAVRDTPPARTRRTETSVSRRETPRPGA